MFMFFSFLFLPLLATVPVLPAPLKRRDVVAPPVTAPNSSSVWTVGSTQTVVWDTSKLPPYENITNRIGEVLLGHLGGGGLNLMINNPLAQGFNITQGSVNIVVPNVPPRTDYLVVLLGDSGDASPTFPITGGSNNTATPSTTPSSPTQTSPSSGGTPASSMSNTSTQPSATPGSGAAASASTSEVTNTFTTSGTPSSTTVVVKPSTTSTTTTSGARSMRPISVTCLTVVLIISGILL